MKFDYDGTSRRFIALWAKQLSTVWFAPNTLASNVIEIDNNDNNNKTDDKPNRRYSMAWW